MRKLNLRLLASLLLAGVAFAGGVHLLHGFQVRRNADVFLREAERAREANKLPEAAQQLRRYLQFVPHDSEALADYGLLLADLVPPGKASARAAYEALERALRADATRTELRRRIVPLTVELGRYTDAQQHLVEYLLPAAPEDSELLLLLASCQQGMGRDSQAGETLRQVVKSDPSSVEAHVRLATLLRRRLDKPEEADAQIEQMIRANPESCEAHVARGDYLRMNRRRDDTAQLDEAMREARTALEKAPEDPAALLLATRCALEQKDYETARAYGRQAVELYPGLREAYMALAAVAVGSGQRSEAIQWLQQGIEKIPKDTDLVWNLANMLLDDGQLEDARSYIDRLREADYHAPLLGYLDARAAYIQSQWLTASRSLEQLRPELTAWPDVVKQVDFYLGGCYQQLGNADQQLTAYRRAVSVDPFWIPARAGVASALRATGRIEEALEQLREIMKLGDAPAVGVIDLIQLEILRNLRLNRDERDWAESQRLLAAARQALPDDARIPILAAEVLVAQDRAEDAERLLQQAQTQNAESVDLRITLAALAQRQRDWERADLVLEQIESDLGDSARLRLARASYLLQRHGAEAAEQLRELSTGSDAFPAEERSRLLGALAGAMLQVGDFDQARGLCHQLAELEPSNLQVRLLLFDLALRAADDAGLEQILDQMHRIEGTGPFWQYGQALKLVLQAGGGQRTEVRGQRTEVRGQRSEDRGQRSEGRGQRTEGRGQRTEDRRQRTEVRRQR